MDRISISGIASGRRDNAPPHSDPVAPLFARTVDNVSEELAVPTWRPAAQKSATLQDCDLQMIAQAIESLELAVILLSANGRLVFSNELGRNLIHKAEAFSLDPSGTLHCRDRMAQSGLAKALSSTRASAPDRSSSAMQILSIPRREKRPLAALLFPQRTLQENEKEAVEDHLPRRLLLLVRDPESALDNCAARIESVFDLSRSESLVAEGLVGGANLQEIADTRGVSIATVRNQLKSVHAKVGVTRQAELVSIMLRTVQF